MYKNFSSFLDEFKLKVHNRVIEEAFWLIIGQASSIFIGFFIMKLITKLGTTDYGKYSLTLSISAFFSSLLFGPIEQGIVRYYHEFEKNGNSKSIFRIYHFSLLFIGLIILCTGLLIRKFNFLEVQSVDLLVIVYYIILFSSSTSYNSVLNLLRIRKANSILQICEKILIWGLLLLIIGTEYFNFTFVLFIISISILIFFISKIYLVKRYLNNFSIQNENINTLKTLPSLNEIFLYISPFIIWGIAGWLQNNSEKWIISNFLSTSQLGIYSLMAVISNYIISTPVGILTQFVQPILFQRISTLSSLEALLLCKKYNRYIIGFIVVLTSFAVLITYFFQNFIIIFLSNESFTSSLNLLPIICLSLGIFNIAQVLANVGIVLKKPHKYFWIKLVIGALSVGFNFSFLKLFGLYGVAFGILFSSVVYLFLMNQANNKLISMLNNKLII